MIETAKTNEQIKKAIQLELAQLDTIVSREYENTLTAFDELKKELQTKYNISIDTKLYTDESKTTKITHKQLLRQKLSEV